MILLSGLMQWWYWYSTTTIKIEIKADMEWCGYTRSACIGWRLLLCAFGLPPRWLSDVSLCYFSRCLVLYRLSGWLTGGFCQHSKEAMSHEVADKFGGYSFLRRLRKPLGEYLTKSVLRGHRRSPLSARSMPSHSSCRRLQVCHNFQPVCGCRMWMKSLHVLPEHF